MLLALTTSSSRPLNLSPWATSSPPQYHCQCSRPSRLPSGSLRFPLSTVISDLSTRQVFLRLARGQTNRSRLSVSDQDPPFPTASTESSPKVPRLTKGGSLSPRVSEGDLAMNVRKILMIRISKQRVDHPRWTDIGRRGPISHPRCDHRRSGRVSQSNLDSKY
jgi:hypothetical protein